MGLLIARFDGVCSDTNRRRIINYGSESRIVNLVFLAEDRQKGNVRITNQLHHHQHQHHQFVTKKGNASILVTTGIYLEVLESCGRYQMARLHHFLEISKITRGCSSYPLNQVSHPWFSSLLFQLSIEHAQDMLVCADPEYPALHSLSF
ncbi:hypothetical protein MKX03_027994 [Papaver bracteatum]|nr:hypothetical protein MKX03_027994 [Papaver bracteatum]